MNELKIEIENSADKLFECECYICQQKFDQYALEVHFVTAHSNVQTENIKKNFECDSFGKSFANARNMMNHIKIVHGGQKDFQCDSCGKLFSRADHLKNHINAVHNGQKDPK